MFGQDGLLKFYKIADNENAHRALPDVLKLAEVLLLHHKNLMCILQNISSLCQPCSFLMHHMMSNAYTDCSTYRHVRQ